MIAIILISVSIVLIIWSILSRPTKIPPKGKAILVTGAASGFGKEVCQILISKQCHVFATDINETKLKELYHDISNVTYFKLDISNQQDVLNAKKYVQEKGLGLFGIVNNAGIAYVPGTKITYVKCVAEYDVDKEVLPMFNVNTFGLMRVTNAFLPLILDKNNNNQGVIVNVASVAGRLAMGASLGVYCCTKHAVVAFTDGLRKDLHGHARVSCIEPGFSNTPMVSNATNQTVLDQNQTILPISKWGNLRKLLNDLEKQKLIDPKHVAEKIVEQLFSDPCTPHVMIDFPQNLFLYYLILLLPSSWGDALLRLSS